MVLQAGFVLVLAGSVLAADGLGIDQSGPDGPDGFVDLDLFVADADGVEGGGGLHGDQGHELEHVVLDHVARGAALVVVAGAVVGADGFADGDLDVIDVFVIPDRLENGVGETHDHQVLDGFLAQIVVDAEDLLFLEILSRTALRCSADLRSRPKGFSMMMRWKPAGCSAALFLSRGARRGR